MKIRNGFVSNSSSSSFIIKKELLTSEQLEGIYNHGSTLPVSYPTGAYGWCTKCDAWKISDVKEHGIEYVCGATYMDNFDMENYMSNILGIDPKIIEWIPY